VGDVILPQACAFDTDGVGQIRIGGWIAQVRYAGPAVLEVLAIDAAGEHAVQAGAEGDPLLLADLHMEEEDDMNYADDTDARRAAERAALAAASSSPVDGEAGVSATDHDAYAGYDEEDDAYDGDEDDAAHLEDEDDDDPDDEGSRRITSGVGTSASRRQRPEEEEEDDVDDGELPDI